MRIIRDQMRSLLVVCFLAVLVSVRAGWDSWNNDIVTHGGPIDNSYIPAIPTGIKRNKGADQIESNLTLRKNQYMFYYNSGGIIGTCKLYCGPRSFLTKDSTNTYYTCYRDQSTLYYGAGSYPSNCVPDVSGSCSATGLSSSCSASSIPANYQALGFTSCCYIPGTGDNLLDRTATTNLTNLYNSE